MMHLQQLLISQASLVGFTVNTPSAAGRVMEKELTVIQSALDNVEHPWCTPAWWNET